MNARDAHPITIASKFAVLLNRAIYVIAPAQDCRQNGIISEKRCTGLSVKVPNRIGRVIHLLEHDVVTASRWSDLARSDYKKLRWTRHQFHRQELVDCVFTTIGAHNGPHVVVTIFQIGRWCHSHGTEVNRILMAIGINHHISVTTHLPESHILEIKVMGKEFRPQDIPFEYFGFNGNIA